MATRPKISEAQTLEHYRVALDNVEKQPQIADTMAEFGYGADTIAAGRTLWQTANGAYLQNKTEDDETTEAYARFSSTKTELASIYSLHRKKAKVIFRKEPLILEKIGIKGRLPQSYLKWLEVIKKFYTEAADTAIQSKLVRLKITGEDITAAQTLLSELETARTEYLKEKGESQNATKAKDQALAELDDWMNEFYAVAEIALEDNPQLLETLNKVVKN